MTETLITKVELYVAELLNKELLPINYYHNAIHTRRVVGNVKELATLEACTEQDTFALVVAAWFHDTGYIYKDEGHEEESVKIAQAFLAQEDVSEATVSLITQLILATKISVSPNTHLEGIIKDADCGHLASDDFLSVSDNLLQEINAKNEQQFTETEWLQENIRFLKTHFFHCKSAKQLWQPKKEINQLKTQKQIDKIAAKERKESQKSKYGRGVETLFRVQLKNHINLSAIADTKANILLSVNAIIISVALSNLIPKLDSPSNLF
jgi:Uncharacterized protein conserved in bacteria